MAAVETRQKGTVPVGSVAANTQGIQWKDCARTLQKHRVSDESTKVGIRLFKGLCWCQIESGGKTKRAEMSARSRP